MSINASPKKQIDFGNLNFQIDQEKGAIFMENDDANAMKEKTKEEELRKNLLLSQKKQ